MSSSKEGQEARLLAEGVSLLGPSRQTSTGHLGLACG